MNRLSVVLAAVVVLLSGCARDDGLEREIRGEIERQGGYAMFCADVAIYGGIDNYLTGVGGSETPFPKRDWKPFRAIAAEECTP